MHCTLVYIADDDDGLQLCSIFYLSTIHSILNSPIALPEKKWDLLRARVPGVGFGDVLQANGNILEEHVGLDEVFDVVGCVGRPVEGEAHGPSVGVQAVPQPAEWRRLFAAHLPAIV